MPRPPDHGKREELLRGIRSYISEYGLADVSLRPLAAALGTSDRMLLHYFETKDNLLAQALASANPEFHSAFEHVDDLPALQSSLRELWRSMTTGTDVQSIRILLQAMGIACVGPGRFTEHVTTMFATLTDTLADSLYRCGAPHTDAHLQATVLAAGFRGLLFDRLITDDKDRTDAAVNILIRDLTLQPR